MKPSLVALLSAIALAACGGRAGETAEPDARPLVVVALAAPLSAPGTVRASGFVGYKREPQLAFNTSGIIVSIEADSGDAVRRNQQLAVIRRTSVGANAREATLGRANAERDLERTRKLYERGFVSEVRLDEARLAVERARDTSVLLAPADGIILRRVAEPAQSVGAGTAVLVLGETQSGIVVRAPVASAQAARIRVGDPTRVRLAEFDGPVHQGQVTRISAKGNERTGAFEVEIEVSAPEGLRSGMVAEVEITATTDRTADAALLVPTLSLLDARADQGVVFVVEAESIAHRRAVRTAGVTQEGVIVVEGLAADERVIGVGAAYVRDGDKVRIAAEN